MPEESPLFSLQPQELIVLLKSGVPISLTLLTNLIAALISYHFVGKYGKSTHYAIMSEYYMIYGFFLLVFVSTNNQGFAILASRLFGAKRYRELGVLYQKNIFTVINLLIIAISLMILFSLVLPSMKGEVLMIQISLIPSVIGASLSNSTKYFLIPQNIYTAPAIIISTSLPIYALLCYIFADLLGMGVSAIGFAKSITDVTALLLLLKYLHFTGVCRNTLIPWTREYFRNWDVDVLREHAKRTSELGKTNSIEILTYQALWFWYWIWFWFGYELEFMDNNVSLKVQGVALCLIYALFCIPWGVSLSMQAKIGSATGEGREEKVKRAMAAAIVLNTLFALVTVLFVVSLRKQVASFFFTDEYSIESLESVLLIFAIAFVFESYANIIGGGLKVIGKEKQVNCAFSVYLLGIVGQCLFGFYCGYDSLGIWLCVAVTAFLKFALIVYQVCVLNLNLKEQVEAIRKALSEEGSLEIRRLIEFSEMA